MPNKHQEDSFSSQYLGKRHNLRQKGSHSLGFWVPRQILEQQRSSPE